MFLQDCCVPIAIRTFMSELLGLLASSSTGVWVLVELRTKRGNSRKKTRTLFDFPLKQDHWKDAATINLVAGSSLPRTQLAFPAPIIVHPLVGPASVSDHRKLDLQTRARKGCTLGWKLIEELRMAAESMAL